MTHELDLQSTQLMRRIGKFGLFSEMSTDSASDSKRRRFRVLDKPVVDGINV